MTAARIKYAGVINALLKMVKNIIVERVKNDA
jgi:hypothetical protein